VHLVINLRIIVVYNFDFLSFHFGGYFSLDKLRHSFFGCFFINHIDKILINKVVMSGFKVLQVVNDGKGLGSGGIKLFKRMMFGLFFVYLGRWSHGMG
jgi:hypothetical protein